MNENTNSHKNHWLFHTEQSHTHQLPKVGKIVELILALISLFQPKSAKVWISDGSTDYFAGWSCADSHPDFKEQILCSIVTVNRPVDVQVEDKPIR